VRGVRDELAPRVIEARKPDAHPVERTREFPELVTALVCDGRVEMACRDLLGASFQPPDPAGEHRGAAVAHQQRDEQGEETGEQDAALDEMDARERVVERRRDEQRASLDRNPQGGLGVAIPVAFHRAMCNPSRRAGSFERDRVVRDVARVLRRVSLRNQRRRGGRERLEDDDASVERLRGVVREKLSIRALQVVTPENRHGPLELRDLRVDEPAPERRYDDEIADTQRDRDDDEQREAEPGADGVEPAHRSRKR
jgi:hypothetical protein